MRNLLAKELKLKFSEVLNNVDGFSFEDGNPFLIKIGADRFFIFLKNISPAYFKNSPDITRVQLPYSEHFKKKFKANIPFIILGYDVDNDTFVCWNPIKVKERLNAKSNVSLYSRNSLQQRIKGDKFKTGFLSNGEKIILFNRKALPIFFERWQTLFETVEIDFKDYESEQVISEPHAEYVTDKIFDIKDKILIAEIKPLLKKNRVLEAVEICSKHYGGKYKSMAFKDWFNLVNDMYRKVNA